MPDFGAYELDLVFHALAHPTRRAILKTLSRQERSVGALAKPFGMSLAAVSKHIQVLARARLVRQRQHGSFSLVSLEPKALAAGAQWLLRLEALTTSGEARDEEGPVRFRG